MKFICFFRCLRVLLWIVCTGASVSCTEFLEKKASSAFALPETLKDLRAMLDNEAQINMFAPSLLEMGTDDIYVRPEVLKARPQAEQLIYSWQQSILRSEIASWNLPYRVIMMSNVILEALDRGVEGRDAEKNIIRGEALFIRAYAYLALAQLYCNTYDETTSSHDLGLPLRVVSDFNTVYARSSVQETYDLIVSDFKTATAALPESVALPTRPSKAAAYGALARTYLIMGRYDDAKDAAERTLAIKNDLLDYNDLDTSSNFPFGVFHDEVIYNAYTTQGLLLAASRALIPEDLYASYDDKDRRKELFFKKSANGDIVFKGNYGGRVASYFSGICTDELYLISAECEARVGDVDKASLVLNTLLEKRWQRNEYVPILQNDRNTLLEIVLLERRKQLLKRGLRWSDLRRLNKDSRFAKILTREVDFDGNIEKYELHPNAVQYTYPIPLAVIEQQAYEQNPI